MTFRERLKEVAYSLLDKLTLGRGIPRSINNIPLRFPPKFSRYYEPSYESDNFTFLREHCSEGDVVLDIGAHIGLYAVMLARLTGPSGHVFSFEPTPDSYQTLREMVRMNGCEQIVTPFQRAISNKSGEASFFVLDLPGCNSNSLVRDRQHRRRSIEVAVTTVDDFVAERNLSVNLLKIDVEGAELAALQGARETFSRCRPKAILALHPPFFGDARKTLCQIWDLVEDYDMEVMERSSRLSREDFCVRMEPQDLFDVHLLPR